MDIFQTEQSRVDKRLEDHLIPLQDLGLQGQIILGVLSDAKRAVEASKLDPKSDDAGIDLEAVKKQLDAYSTNAGLLVKTFTSIVTQIKYGSLSLQAHKYQAKNYHTMDPRSGTFWSHTTAISSLHRSCYYCPVGTLCNGSHL